MRPAANLALAASGAWVFGLQYRHLAPTPMLKGQHPRRAGADAGTAAGAVSRIYQWNPGCHHPHLALNAIDRPNCQGKRPGLLLCNHHAHLADRLGHKWNCVGYRAAAKAWHKGADW